MKKRSRKCLIRLLDQACSQRAKKNHLIIFGVSHCQFCAIRGSFLNTIADQCFHMLSRQHYSTRWEENNCLWSCGSCNILYEQDADFVAKVVDWYVKKFGAERWGSLVKLYHTPTPIKTYELQEKLEAMR